MARPAETESDLLRQSLLALNALGRCECVVNICTAIHRALHQAFLATAPLRMLNPQAQQQAIAWALGTPLPAWRSPASQDPHPHPLHYASLAIASLRPSSRLACTEGRGDHGSRHTEAPPQTPATDTYSRPRCHGQQHRHWLAQAVNDPVYPSPGQQHTPAHMLPMHTLQQPPILLVPGRFHFKPVHYCDCILCSPSPSPTQQILMLPRFRGATLLRSPHPSTPPAEQTPPPTPKHLVDLPPPSGKHPPHHPYSH
jgi:hypothetical protein